MTTSADGASAASPAASGRRTAASDVPDGATCRVAPNNYPYGVANDDTPDENAVTVSESDPTSTAPRRTWKTVTTGLLHPPPGPRKPATRPLKPISTVEIVTGLDRREITFGIASTAIAAGLAALGYFAQHASKVKTTRQEAATFLITMLIATALLGLGTALRRRALLGFAAFLVGLEQLSYKFLPGALLFFAFGGWLISRVMTKNRQDRAKGGGPAARRSKTVAPPPVRAPKASKRYTPPKRTPSGRSR